MTTKDKVVAMFHKTAAARQLNAKILQKRAEFAKSAAAVRLYGKVMQKRAALRGAPSEAYMAGFCKAAEAYGVDPVELMKTAQLNRLLARGVIEGLRGMKPGATAVLNGLRTGAEGLVHGVAEAIPPVSRGLGKVNGGLNALFFGPRPRVPVVNLREALRKSKNPFRAAGNSSRAPGKMTAI